MSETFGHRGPWIQTRSGKKFYYLTSGFNDVEILDIAHGLAFTCRWMGQCSSFYSVAQHSVLLSLVVPKEIAFYALLHDASEAYLGDLCTPLKNTIEIGNGYKKMEERIQNLIEHKFNVQVPLSFDYFKSLDSGMAAAEAKVLGLDLYREDEGWLAAGEPVPIRINPWTPENSKRAFIKRFHDLDGRREEQGKFLADSGMYW